MTQKCKMVEKVFQCPVIFQGVRRRRLSSSNSGVKTNTCSLVPGTQPLRVGGIATVCMHKSVLLCSLKLAHIAEDPVQGLTSLTCPIIFRLPGKSWSRWAWRAKSPRCRRGKKWDNLKKKYKVCAVPLEYKSYEPSHVNLYCCCCGELPV